MIRKAITCFAIIVVQVIVVGFTSAGAADVGRHEERDFAVRCEEGKYDCTTTFLKNSVDVSCTHWPAPPKGQPISASITSIYKCNIIVSGARSWACKGYIGAAPDLRATFTEEEFRDHQLRCDKICQPCAQGWK